jgi:hypothetical protein
MKMIIKVEFLIISTDGIEYKEILHAISIKDVIVGIIYL